jgi:hypothetical protein
MPPVIGHEWVEERRAPLYVVRFPRTARDAEVDAFCKALAAWWPEVRERVWYIVDARQVQSAPAVQRKRFGEQENASRPYTGTYHAGAAMVVSSQLVRGLITAVYWLSPPNYQHIVTTDMRSAEAWIEARRQAESRWAG